MIDLSEYTIANHCRIKGLPVHLIRAERTTAGVDGFVIYWSPSSMTFSDLAEDLYKLAPNQLVISQWVSGIAFLREKPVRQ